MNEKREEIRREILSRLTGAPDSPAKADVVEELTEKLFAAYEDLLAEGMEPDMAFRAALETLGDTEELVAYLNSLEAEDAPVTDAESGKDPGFGATVEDADALDNRARDGRRAAEEIGNGLGKLLSGVADIAGGALSMAADALRTGSYSTEDRRAVAADLPHEKVASSPCLKNTKDGWVVEGDIRVIDAEVPRDIVLSEADCDSISVRIHGRRDLVRIHVKDGVLVIRRTSLAVLPYRIVNPGIEMVVPRRHWNLIRAMSFSGTVRLQVDQPTRNMQVGSVSGAVDVRTAEWGELEISTMSGSVTCAGSVRSLKARSVSGKLNLSGTFAEMEISSTSGDTHFTGTAKRVNGRAISGKICLEPAELPGELNLSAVSGNISVTLPEQRPFQVRLSTTSGRIASDFHTVPRGSHDVSLGYPNPSGTEGPIYTMKSVNGGISIRRAGRRSGN